MRTILPTTINLNWLIENDNKQILDSGTPNRSVFGDMVQCLMAIRAAWVRAPGPKLNFNQIFTKSDQILTIYVKNHSIHVKQIQERHFLEITKKQRQESHRIWVGVLG